MDKNWTISLTAATEAPPTMQSIFASVNIGADTSRVKKETLTPRTLQVDESFLKNEQYNAAANLALDLEKLKSVDLLNDDDTVFHIAQKYGWRIAPDTNAPVGVSWFDDFRIRQALDACGEAPEGYLLIKGDLTGIQNFIYSDINLDIIGGAKNIAKRLRGKSFFVSLLTDLLAEYLLEELDDLPIWNLLFAGGGHFNILVANNKSTRKTINAWEKKTHTYLNHQLKGLLGLVMAQYECPKDLTIKANHYFGKLNQERDRQKYRQGEEYLNELFYPERKEQVYFNAKFFENIGYAVPKNRILLQISVNQPLLMDEGEENVLTLVYRDNDGHYVYLANDEKDVEQFLKSQQDIILRAKVLQLNDTNFLPDSTSPKASYGFKLIGKETPTKEGSDELKDFEEITEEWDENGKQRYEMMAAMRLDVDDLGCIFNYGLGDKTSLQQVVALSREMSFFFSGYFNYLANKHHVYVVYSGGDDAFVVGHWWRILHFARDLQQEFNKFTCDNPNVHFSAGIYFCDAHYPVAKFADDAKYLLDDEAKKVDGKNYLSVFNHLITWKDFDEMLRFGEKIAQYSASDDRIKSEKLARSIVNRVLTVVKNSYHEKTIIEHGKEVKRGQIRAENFYRNVGNLQYLFARQGYDKKVLDDNGDQAGNIVGDVIRIILNAFTETKKDDTKTATANNLKVALNYALYKLRELVTK